MSAAASAQKRLQSIASHLRVSPTANASAVATALVPIGVAADTKEGGGQRAGGNAKPDPQRNGGLQIAKALLEQRVKVVYTLTGGKEATTALVHAHAHSLVSPSDAPLCGV
jgi:hypothetical protein